MTRPVRAPVVKFAVYGSPAPQGSKRFVGTSGGRGRMVESSKAVAPWREAVRSAAVEYLHGGSASLRYEDYPTWVPLAGPLAASLIFTVRKPSSAPKRTRTWPATRPDVDKYARATLDALRDAGVYADDGQVVTLAAEKCYPGEHHAALSSPGVRISIALVTS